MRRLAFILASAVLVHQSWTLPAAENDLEDEGIGGQSGKHYGRNCAQGHNTDSTGKPSKKTGSSSSPQTSPTSPLPPQPEPEKKETRRLPSYGPGWNLDESPFEESPRWPYANPNSPINSWDYPNYRPPYHNFGYVNHPRPTAGRFLQPPFGNNRFRSLGYRSSSSEDEEIFKEMLTTWPEGHNSVYHDPDSGKSYAFFWTPIEN